MRYLLALVLLFAGFLCAHGKANNVCKTFLAYYTYRDRNPNCYHNPDMYLPVPKIIHRHGYPVENYTVVTPDGYILTVFRIPHGRRGSKQDIGPPVFIQHGIGVSSMAFVNIGEKSLAFVLADSGYDVWLGNFRGSNYSNTHVTWNKNQRSYWNFTFHELGIYDLPVQLDLVAKITNQKVFYIGHSMGTTAYYVYNVENHKIARERIKIAISLAPIAFVHYIETPLKALVPEWILIYDVLKATTDGSINQITPQRTDERKICLPDPVRINLCQTMGHLLYGFDPMQEDMETLPITFMQDTDAISLKAVTHYIQLVQSNDFRQFDYGKGNYEAYGSSVPPQYNLSKINVPNNFIRAHNDPLATRKNVEKTYAALPKDAKPFDLFLIPYETFSHSDFVLAKDVKRLLYDHIVQFLEFNREAFL